MPSPFAICHFAFSVAIGGISINGQVDRICPEAIAIRNAPPGSYAGIAENGFWLTPLGKQAQSAIDACTGPNGTDFDCLRYHDGVEPLSSSSPGLAELPPSGMFGLASHSCTASTTMVVDYIDRTMDGGEIVWMRRHNEALDPDCRIESVAPRP